MTERIKFIARKEELTIEDINEVINYIVNIVSESLNIKHSHTRLCKESSMAVATLCEKLNIPYIPFSMGEVGMGELEHHFGITGFNTKYGQICVLIDLTYVQFTEKTYPINLKNDKITKLVPSPGMFVSSELKEQLVNSKYMVLTENNFEEYISGFIESYRMANPLDERSAYDQLYELLSTFGINFSDEDYLNSQVKTY